MSVGLALTLALIGAPGESVELFPIGAVVPGDGFDTAGGELAQRCARAAGVMTDGASKSDLRFDRPLARDAEARTTLLERLGLRSGERLRLVALRAGLEARLVEAVLPRPGARTAVFGGSFRLAAERAALATLSDLALGAPRSALGLRRTCGDRYVNAVERGGRLLVAVVAESPRELDRGLLDGTLATARARLAALGERLKDELTVQVLVLQHGGDASAPWTLLDTPKVEGELPARRCKGSALEPCLVALEALEGYGRERFAAEVTAHPVPIAVELERYETAGLKVPPEKTQARRDKVVEPLQREFESGWLEARGERARAARTRPEAPRLAARIDARSDQLDRRLESLADALHACFGQDERACKQTVKELGGRPGVLMLDVLPETFGEHCEAARVAGAEPRLARLFARLEAWAGDFDPEWVRPGSDRCAALAGVLPDALELDLVGLDLRSVSPLAGLMFKRLETVRLQGNPLESLSGLDLAPGARPRILVSLDPATLRGCGERLRCEQKKEEAYEFPWRMNAVLRSTPLVKLGIPAGRICVVGGASGKWARGADHARVPCAETARTIELKTPPSRVQEIDWVYDDANADQEGTCNVQLRCWED